MTNRIEALTTALNLRIAAFDYHTTWLTIHRPFMTEEMKSSWDQTMIDNKYEIDTLKMQIKLESAAPLRKFDKIFA